MKSKTFIESRIAGLQNCLLNWYRKAQRKLPWRETSNPYHIWISEVMLQQTQVNTVIPYYDKFLKKFPTIADLANSDQQTVLKIWEGLGYYARARNLHKAAKIIVEEMNGGIPRKYQELRTLPGVGDYIASAVLSIADSQPYPVVDGNVKRVLARLLLIKAPVNDPQSLKVYKDTAEKLLPSSQAGLFNQAIMELGAVICRPRKPLCNQCPVHQICRAFAQNLQQEFPVKKKKQKIPQYHIAVGVLRKGEKVLITRRAENGLLGGLWEFPGGKVRDGETAAEACIREFKEEVNLAISIESYLTRVKHAYSHFRIVMDVFVCNYVSGRVKLKGVEDFRWITLNEINQFPFPKANHKLLPWLRKFYE